MRNSLPFIPLLLVVALLMGSGCTTPVTDRDVYSDKVIKSFFAKPTDPRRYNLTVYQSKYGPVFSGANRLHPAQLGTADFISPSSSAAPVIDVRGRKPELFPALIDTGSRDSWANLSAANMLSLKPMGPPPYKRYADHMNDPLAGYAGYATKLKIDTVYIENVVIYIRAPHITLGPIKRGVEDPTPYLVVGCDILKQMAFVRFDFPEEKVYFSSTKKYKTDSERVLADVAYEKPHGVFAVDAWIDGKSTPLIVDTGGDFELAWNKRGGTRIKRLFIGDLALVDVEVTDTETNPFGYPEIPRIGRRLLRRFSVTLDNKRRHVIFERPAPSTWLWTKPKPSTATDEMPLRREVDAILP